MKKFISVLLTLAMCASLALPAAAGTTETFTGKAGTADITVSISNVIAKKTVTVTAFVIADFAYGEYEGTALERTVVLYQVPESGAKLTINVNNEGASAYLGVDGYYEIVDGGLCYTFTDEGLDGTVFGSPLVRDLSFDAEETAKGFVWAYSINSDMLVCITSADINAIASVGLGEKQPVKNVKIISDTDDGPITTTIKGVLNERTLTVSFSNYRAAGSDNEKEVTIYQIPESGAELIFEIPKGASVCPWSAGAYHLKDGEYNYVSGSYIGMLTETTLSFFDSPYSLPFTLVGENGINAGTTSYDLVCISNEIFSGIDLYFTCADLDDIVGVESKPEITENPFTDVAADAYYADAVKWAYEKNVTKGTSATTFGPMETCTRGQVVTFLWRAKGCPEPTTTVNPFTDVAESDYFYKAVLWAVENGITNGVSDTTFGSGNTCTSAHVVTFLWRANGKPAAAGESTMADSGQWYSDAVAWADGVGLLNGTDVPFAVTNNAPRADIVTYLYRDNAV